MTDQIEKMGHSTIQHGKLSDRIYLMHVDVKDFPNIIYDLEELAKHWNYTKIFAKIPAIFLPNFINDGYQVEALIPGFFSGKEDGVFLGKFRDNTRYQPAKEALSVFQQLLLKPFHTELPPMNAQYNITELLESHIPAMCDLYREVFPVYPFPIHDPNYLKQTMDSHVRYFGVFKGKKLVGLSSAEMEQENLNVEMTDFAVLPTERGAGLANYLLEIMEKEMRKAGLITSYTIARLNSPGMNRAFQKAGYRYSGTLIKNTRISTGIEDMNIWYKSL